MYLFENAVLQRGLLLNLRMRRSFVLLFFYNALLGLIVYAAWPQDSRLDLTTSPIQAKRLVNLFFLGQYILASLMTPSFAAASITGEKERKTYEMLLASPMQPKAIILGKWLASLTHLAILIFTSLPIVMLCLPLGGISPYEVLAAYLGLTLSVMTFGMISIACSSYFQRTVSALAVSYLIILPLALLAILLWYGFIYLNVFTSLGEFRLLLPFLGFPLVCIAICASLYRKTSNRLLYPPDVGSEGKDVVDVEQEAEEAVGLVIQRDQFPDRLFAPAKRTVLLQDGVNPVYDKEMRSEIFSQGTLMLRVVIQVSMLLAIPLMACFLYIWPNQTPWYIAYVLVFNMLVGPVFSAGAITSERERETLDLLLTTTISPLQILSGKLIAGLRISSVLTMFLIWPVLLACVMVAFYWKNLLPVGAYLLIVLLTCLTTANLALFHSVIFRKTSHSLMVTYLVIATLFCMPLAVKFFSDTFFLSERATRTTEIVGITSPFMAAFQVPLANDEPITQSQPKVSPESIKNDSWQLPLVYMLTTAILNLLMLGIMTWLFNSRWRVAR